MNKIATIELLEQAGAIATNQYYNTQNVEYNETRWNLVWLTNPAIDGVHGPKKSYPADVVIAAGLALPPQLFLGMMTRAISLSRIEIIEHSGIHHGKFWNNRFDHSPGYFTFTPEIWDMMSRSTVEANRLAAYFYDERYALCKKEPVESDASRTINTGDVILGEGVMTLNEFIEEGLLHRRMAKANIDSKTRVIKTPTIADLHEQSSRFLKTAKDRHFIERAKKNKLSEMKKSK